MFLSDEEIKQIDKEVRRRIFEYLDSQNRKPEEIDRSTWYRIKKNERGIGDETLKKMLSELTPEEFANILTGDVSNNNVRIDTLNGAILYINDSVKKFKQIIEKFPELSSYLVDQLMPFISGLSHEVIITQDHIKKFETILKQRSLSRGTVKNHLFYLKRILKDLNYRLSSDTIAEYIVSLKEENANIALLTSEALKLFIKEVLKDRLLYDAFKTPMVNAKRRIPNEFLNLDIIKKIFNNITYIPSRALFLLLAETGWRPNEIYNLKLNNIDFETRIIHLEKVTRTKRAYITFLHEETEKWLKDVYLPYREEFISKYESSIKTLIKIDVNHKQSIDEWKARLFPFAIDNLRSKIRESIAKILGEELAKNFTLYYLRHFWSTYMRRQNAPADIVNLLQGRAPPREFKILVEGYTHYSLEDLRKVYEKYAPRLL
ncbi:tyrosine-type recombinase/integrase [Saccharolobus islandicus]|uniref:Integrase family protein n=1 Tax=Saccharolobus islandicus (strain M.16.27) TaxID=427318 RepID=C3N208_SACI3|nr:site-specific integrase [Sulfolobus islandicus]ACP54418.1 integrase family protein [Sulfolobus islandicus M.16.27]